eukprot:scaffold1102_cov256-Pinguiococcus_pyrenoidosus.AAC.52
MGVFVAEAGPNRVAVHQAANEGTVATESRRWIDRASTICSFRGIYMVCFDGPDAGKGYVVISLATFDDSVPQRQSVSHLHRKDRAVLASQVELARNRSRSSPPAPRYAMPLLRRHKTNTVTSSISWEQISTSAKSSRRRSSTLPTRRSCLTRSKLRFIRVSDILEAKRQTVGSSNKEGGEMLFSLVCLFCFFSLCSLFSKLVARVDRYDAGGQRLEHHLSEARFAHHRRKELRGGKLPDRLHKILIRVGIARNHRTKPGWVARTAGQQGRAGKESKPRSAPLRYQETWRKYLGMTLNE